MSWLVAWRIARAAVARVPWQLWALIAGVLIIWLGMRWHDARVRDLRKEVRAETIQEIRDQVAIARAQAEKSKMIADQQMGRINEQVRGSYVQSREAIRDRAAALRMRDQAQAARRPVAGGSTVPSVPGGAAGNAGTAQGDGLPREAAVDLLEQCDLNTANLVSWQDWYRAQARAHEEWRQTHGGSLPDDLRE